MTCEKCGREEVEPDIDIYLVCRGCQDIPDNCECPIDRIRDCKVCGTFVDGGRDACMNCGGKIFEGV